MKELFLNNQKAVIDKETFFPFTQKVNDINDVTILNFPATKTVQLPRCPMNDEIFGYVAEITRIAVGFEDSLVGISFNQIKKVEYKLFNDSELISEGIVRITDITELYYEIELYDRLIDLLETFKGDTETGEGFLNDMELIIDGEPYAIYCTANNVKNLNDANGELIPAVNISEFQYKENLARITYDPSTGSSYAATVELSENLTPIQFRTLKPYDFEYNVPISTVINSINYYYSGITEITYDDYCKDIFDTVRFNMGKPKPITIRENIQASGVSFDLPLAYRMSEVVWDFKDLSGNTIGKNNGKYYIELPITISFTTPDDTHAYYIYLDEETLTWKNVLFPEIDLGIITATVKILTYSGSTLVYSSHDINIDINMVRNQNVRVVFDPTDPTLIEMFEVSAVLPVDFEYYYRFFNDDTLTNKLSIVVGRDMAILSWVSDFPHQNTIHASTFYTYGWINEINGIYNNESIRTGDILNGKTLFPKVSIQDFLLNIIKYYNLGIEIDNLNNSINIFKKQYYLTSETLLIDEVSNIQISNFDFSKVILSNQTSTNSNFKNYEEYTKKKYAEQVVDTGYSIRNTKKEVKFDTAIPPVLKDYNEYAYNSFASYYNYGYSKGMFGVTEGLVDKVTLGYNKITNDIIWVSNDTLYEANIEEGDYLPTEKKFTHANLNLTYDEATSAYIYPAFDPGSGSTSRQLATYNTLTPYIFSGSTITKSLEFAKPVYNFADIQDANYSSGVTHYANYWQKYIRDIWDVNTHILTTRIFINGVIDIFKVYNYKNTFYIISEIVEYDPTLPGIYEVKLLRINNLEAYNIIFACEFNGGQVERIYSGTTTTTTTANPYTYYIIDVYGTGCTLLGDGVQGRSLTGLTIGKFYQYSSQSCYQVMAIGGSGYEALLTGGTAYNTCYDIFPPATTTTTTINCSNEIKLYYSYASTSCSVGTTNILNDIYLAGVACSNFNNACTLTSYSNNIFYGDLLNVGRSSCSVIADGYYVGGGSLGASWPYLPSGTWYVIQISGNTIINKYNCGDITTTTTTTPTPTTTTTTTPTPTTTTTTTAGPSYITDGLVAFLDAQSYSGSGSTWYDLTDNNINGTLRNGVTWTYDSGFTFHANPIDGVRIDLTLSQLTGSTLVIVSKSDTPTSAVVYATDSNYAGHLGACSTINYYNSAGLNNANTGVMYYNVTNKVNWTSETGYTNPSSFYNKIAMIEFKNVNFASNFQNNSIIVHEYFNSSFTTNGNLYAIMIYSKTLTTQESQANLDYFLTKYNIT